MRILITGASGLIGGRLAEHLLGKGNQVILGSRNLINPSSNLAGAEVVKMDWTNQLSLEKCCEGVDMIVHSAGINNRECNEDPVAALSFNGLATARFSMIANLMGVKKFIYISTAHVYKDPLVGTFSEDSCVKNLNPYATSRHAAEQFLLGGSNAKKIQTIVLRLSNAFGSPIEKKTNCWSLLVNDLCRQAVVSNLLKVNSSGMQMRDFIDISLVCRVIEDLLTQHYLEGGAELFNLGSGEPRTVKMMAELIKERCKVILNSNPNLVFRCESDSEVNYNFKYSIEKIKSTGLAINTSNFTYEIDKLLLFCKQNF